MSILALETSCDDTCAAVIGHDGTIRSNVISSQRAHDRFGGVVPEIASRHHLELVNLVVERSLQEAGASLDEIDLVAATLLHLEQADPSLRVPRVRRTLAGGTVGRFSDRQGNVTRIERVISVGKAAK